MSDASAEAVPVAVEGLHGPIRLKWHMLRTRAGEAPFRPANLALGWRLGASLEIDVSETADHRFVVAHDATLGPATTGRGRVAAMPLAVMAGLRHRDRAGAADPDAPVLGLGELLAPLRSLPGPPATMLQLDLKLPEVRPVPEAVLADAAAAAAGLEPAIIVSSYFLEQCRQVAAALPGARVGYDPWRAVSRDPGLARDPSRLLRHLERRRDGVEIAYLHHGLVVGSEARGFPLVRRLLDLGIATDAWTLNPGPKLSKAMLRSLVDSGVRQITTDAPIELAREITAL